MMAVERNVLIVSPGGGEDVGGVICKVRAEQTDGAYSILELTLPPGAGAPLHVHYREDEIFYVADGECEIQFEGQTSTAETGSVVVLPKGLPHAFRNPGAVPTKLLITAVPGGLEKFFEESGAVAADDPERRAKLGDIARRYQLDFSPGG
jgi:mannose-6-phosphate isomerase-like protein (cupin superfamily)